MKIDEIGGEFALIERIRKKAKDKNVKVGIGDDAAVVDLKKLSVLTTDTLVEGDHFSLDYFSAEQIGMKAIEINMSDIAAMGAVGKYVLVSLVLPRDIDVSVIEGIYDGMWKKCDKYKLDIVGGNITHGKQLVITIAVIGEVKDVKLRSKAKPGDFILVSGHLGGSAAGLHLFLNKIKGFEKVKKKHLEPESSRIDFIKYVNAMIDVSDGLASEVKHICEESNVGAVIYKDNIPITDDVFGAAKALCMDAYDFALYGGEDFELVYTVSEKNLGKVKGFLVGEIRRRKGLFLYSKGKEKLISKKGYDHFG